LEQVQPTLAEVAAALILETEGLVALVEEVLAAMQVAHRPRQALQTQVVVAVVRRGLPPQIMQVQQAAPVSSSSNTVQQPLLVF
jgi:hypothetical protein